MNRGKPSDADITSQNGPIYEQYAHHYAFSGNISSRLPEFGDTWQVAVYKFS